MTQTTPKFSTLLFLTLAGTACVADEHSGESDVDADLRSGPLEDEACPEHRQIARRDPIVPGCPSVTGWQAEPLFDDASGQLAEYCRYTWTLNGQPVDVAALENHPDLSGVSSDCEVVFEQSLLTQDALWTEVGADMTELFHHAIGRADSADLDLAATYGLRVPVVVTVVDSVPHDAPLNPRSEHGEQMVRIIEDLACPDPLFDCSVTVDRSLGLPRYGTGQVDLVRGGYFGTWADVAQGIYAAVDRWQTTDWPGETPKLIINLSVGSERMFGDYLGPNGSAAIEALYAAIAYARCHEDVLLIGAAGNQGHLCTDGPLIPGSWEEQEVPSVAACVDLGAVESPTLTGDYQPLLYSVGGLDHEFERMPGTRPEGMPRLAAMSTHAVAGNDSTALTGTSVSAAVTAGAAALVWSYNPALSPAQVMDAVYDGATPMSWNASYVGPDLTDASVHAVHACGALAAACAEPGSTCPTMPLDCVDEAPSVTLQDVFDNLATLTPVEIPATYRAAVNCPADCNGSAIGYLHTTVPNPGLLPCPAPIQQTAPYTLPQPIQIGCPNCTLDISDYAVLASIDPAYKNSTINDVLISVFDGGQTIHYRLGKIALSVGTITKLRLDNAPPAVVSATISITFDTEPRPVVDDLLIGL